MSSRRLMFLRWIHQKASLLLAAIAFSVASCFCSQASADDTGIDKTRLIEHANGQYAIEVDTLPRLAAAYRKPIFPARFKIAGPPERELRKGYLLIRYRFETDGESLNSDDTILLPWGRAGVSLTMQWSDGNLQQALFLRDIVGIPIDISTFRSASGVEQSSLLQHILTGATQVLHSPELWLLAFTLIVFARDQRAFGMILMLALGGAIGMVAADCGAPALPLPVVRLCMGIGALLMLRDSLGEDQETQRHQLMLITLGVLYGLADLDSVNSHPNDILVALLGRVIGLTTSLAVIVALGFAVITLLKKTISISEAGPLAAYAIGGLGVALILIRLTTVSVASDPVDRSTVNFRTPAIGQALTKKLDNQQLRADQSSEPVNGYLTVEPFEVRLELLIQFKTAFRFANPDADTVDRITIAELERLKNLILKKYRTAFQMNIDGQKSIAIFEQADFVQVLSNGIAIRENAVDENAESAMLGLVYAFETDGLADNVQLSWNVFEPSDFELPCVILDPFGTSKQRLTQTTPELTWKNAFVGFEVAKETSNPVQEFSIPIVPLAILMVALLAVWSSGRRNSRRLAWVAGIAATIGFMLYPYARVSASIPAANAWLIDNNDASSIVKGLLTNAYRAFEIRDEGKLYDRLEQSIEGDQLREFYLQSRRSLEMQERGGARARIDKVEILEIDSIRGGQDGELIVGAKWIASGHVNHFGHTHYRNNFYEAEVVIVPIEGFWKIKRIQILDEQTFL